MSTAPCSEKLFAGILRSSAMREPAGFFEKDTMKDTPAAGGL